VSDTGAFGVPVHAGRGGAGGACTNAMLRFLSDDRHGDTWVSLLVSMQSYLAREGYDQVPQLSVGHRDFKLTDPFSVLHPKCKGPGHLSGKTRAVFIGINYPGSACPLAGACNDVDAMRRYITTRGFADDKHSIRILKDVGGDAGAGDVTPTKTNIEAALAWLVSGAQDGDSLFLHYSGHGSKKTDTNHDEEDGFDEVLLPCDFMEEDAGKKRILLDDDIYRAIVAPLPTGVSLVAVMDCCHSGTLLDLPYTCVLTSQQVTFVPSSGFNN